MFVAPRTALVWDGKHSIYFAGAFVQVAAWSELLHREVMPMGQGTLKAYVTAGAAATVFAGYPLQRRERVLYRGGELAVPDWPSRLSAGFRISEIHDRFAELDRLNNFADVTAEIESGWNSVADFRRTGFGFAAHDDGDDRVLVHRRICQRRAMRRRHRDGRGVPRTRLRDPDRERVRRALRRAGGDTALGCLDEQPAIRRGCGEGRVPQVRDLFDLRW